MHSATPFCCQVPTTIFYLSMYCSLQKSMNLVEVYSPPLSVLRCLIFFPIQFSTKSLNFLKQENLSFIFFLLSMYNNTFLEKLSIKETKHDAPPMDATGESKYHNELNHKHPQTLQLTIKSQLNDVYQTSSLKKKFKLVDFKLGSKS